MSDKQFTPQELLDECAKELRYAAQYAMDHNVNLSGARAMARLVEEFLASFPLSETGTNSASQVPQKETSGGDDVRETAGSRPVKLPQPALAESPDKKEKGPEPTDREEVKIILQRACDRSWEDETLYQTAVIAANAIYWRDREIENLRKDIAKALANHNADLSARGDTGKWRKIADGEGCTPGAVQLARDAWDKHPVTFWIMPHGVLYEYTVTLPPVPSSDLSEDQHRYVGEK